MEAENHRPANLVVQGLYIGGLSVARNLDWLHENDIRMIVQERFFQPFVYLTSQASKQLTPAFPEEFNYIVVRVEDDGEECSTLLSFS